MVAERKRHGAVPFATRAAAPLATLVLLLAADLAIPESFWPTVLYGVVVLGTSLTRRVSIVAIAVIFALTATTAVGVASAASAPGFISSSEFAGRVAVGITILLIYPLSIQLTRGLLAPPGYPSKFARDFLAASPDSNGSDPSLDARSKTRFTTPAGDYTAELEHRLGRLLEVLPIMVWTAKPTGEIDFVNEAGTDYFGLPAEEILGEKWLSLLHPDDREQTLAKWASSIETGAAYAVHHRLRSRDGVYRWFAARALAEKDTSGTVVRWWGTTIDVHEERERAADVRRVLDARERILENIGDGVAELDHDWRIAFVSEQGAALMGATVEQQQGRILWELSPEMKGTILETEYLKAVETRQRTKFSIHNPLYGKWLEVTATPTEHGLTVAYRDTTETRELQASLQQAQRLESVGQLTGGIAHDFNNLLTVVIGGAEALESGNRLNDADFEMTNLIAEAARQGADLITSLMAFARQMPLDSRPTDLNKLVRTIEPLLRHTLGENVAIRFDLSSDLPSVTVDDTQFESAVINLAINARDAMPEGGSLAIDTRLASINDDYAARDPELEAGTYVVISVSDTGAGISPEHLPHLFDPFFTTKPADYGSGLGLAMVWGFAKESNGHVTVYSEPGLGTTFNLYLPISDEAPSSPQPGTESGDVRGSGVILVTEDNDLVRAFAIAQLSAHGYDVHAASNSKEALKLLDDIEQLDLLFTDVVMPGGMTGTELAKSVVDRRPQTAVLFTSGYTQEIMESDGRIESGVDLLRKPYTGRQLTATVSQILKREAATP